MKKFILFACIAAVLSACTPQHTRMEMYPKMYEEKPVTVLIMPPINNTNNADAKEYFYSTLAKPLSEKGYYVVSPFLAMDLLKQESAYDSELFVNGSLDPFRNVFNADAVLFTTINKWEKKAAASVMQINIEYTLKSTKTGEILFQRDGDLVVDFGSGGNSLLGMALDVLSTALTDHVVAARRCNNYVLRDMPEGKYGLNYMNDGKVGAGDRHLKGAVKN